MAVIKKGQVFDHKFNGETVTVKSVSGSGIHAETSRSDFDAETETEFIQKLKTGGYNTEASGIE